VTTGPTTSPPCLRSTSTLHIYRFRPMAAVHDDGVPLHAVETALLLESLRRSLRLAGPHGSRPSLACFFPVNEEVQAHPVPAG
jgi:hypothetical protein